MWLHFSEEELAGRRQKATAAMEAQGYDGLLMFRQESMYYLTGYDTMGYSQFQCLYMGPDGDLVLLTRSPDLRQSRSTSIIEDVRIWMDRGDANPGLDLRDILEEKGRRGKRLGVELEAWTLTGRRWEMVKAALDGFCDLEDASHLVSELRLVKSDAEVAYVRKAAELADDALEEAHRLIAPGVPELELFAGMHGVIFRGGGDYPAGRWIIGSGERALMVRHITGHGTIGENDQVALEFGAAYRHYHSCLMRTVLTGRPDAQHVRMHAAGVAALKAAQGACKPGATFGDVFDAHAKVFDDAGFREHRLNACGYSLGALYPPTWMDYPMLFTGNPVVIQPNMVIFMHMILLDSDRGLTMSPGETVLVTETGCQRLSRMSLDLVVK
ncbi:MAG: aminopeptidase P family protein [Chloroflexi bacterium]|nr:aminopeptidase P family protein [Chloroflexota bacterium]